MGAGGTSVMKLKVEVQAPRLHYVHPICFEAGKPMEFVATIEDEVPHRVPEVTKCRLELVLVLAEFSEINFEDVEGFDVGEV